METKSIARVNNVAIQVISDNGSKSVPIRPICEALGIDYPTQFNKLKEDEFLSSTIGLSPTVAGDGKDREMVCIPYKYVFGWLFTINPKNVKEEARESVAMYRAKCYDVLFNYFAEQSDYLEFKQTIVNEKIEKYEELRVNFKLAEKNLREAKQNLFRAKDLTYEEWKTMQQQQSINFVTEEAEGENE